MVDNGGNGPLLRVDGLTVGFATEGGLVRAVNDVTFEVGRGDTVAIVGESGSGKTVTALAILGLLDGPSVELGGRALLDGTDLLRMSPADLRRVRGARVAMIFQDPLSALHPFFRVVSQIEEAILLHEDIPRSKATRRAVELLDAVGISDPERRGRCYPHEFSGGMRQRVMIAMAMACRPEILIADEPTTALDVTVQAQILELLRGLRTEFHTSLVLITHDLGVVAGEVDTVYVMYGGRIVESAPTLRLFSQPLHPYTRGLLRSVIRLDEPLGERLYAIGGQPPDPLGLPVGCAFHLRCPDAFEECRERVPPFDADGDGFGAACHLVQATSGVQ